MRSEERKNELGEVFTPPELVQEMLDQLPPESWTDPSKTFLEPSCGNGNFLVAILERLLEHGHQKEQALSRMYGVDLMLDNVQETRERLDPQFQFSELLERNIVCADALLYHYRFDGSAPYDPTKEEKQEELLNNLFDFS